MCTFGTNTRQMVSDVAKKTNNEIKANPASTLSFMSSDTGKPTIHSTDT